MATLKDLKASEKAIERAKKLVAKREGLLADARTALQLHEEIHRNAVREYAGSGAPRA